MVGALDATAMELDRVANQMPERADFWDVIKKVEYWERQNAALLNQADPHSAIRRSSAQGQQSFLRIRRRLGRIPQPSAHGAPKEDIQRSPARGSLGVQYALNLTPRETTTLQWERDVPSSQQLGKETCTRSFLT